MNLSEIVLKSFEKLPFLNLNNEFNLIATKNVIENIQIKMLLNLLRNLS